MKEAEFRALLAIEGKTLLVTSTYTTRWDHDWRSQYKVWQAEIWTIKDNGDIKDFVDTTGYVQRRYYAVQSLIKRYYGDRG